jgi:hypothetical protein
MRFGILVAAVVAGGALMGAAAQFLLDPASSPVAAGQGNTAKVKFDIADLNPIRLIYDDVMKQVTTDANRPSFAVGTPVPVADFSKVDAQIKLNTEKFQRMNGSANISGLPESGPR